MNTLVVIIIAILGVIGLLIYIDAQAEQRVHDKEEMRGSRQILLEQCLKATRDQKDCEGAF